MSATTATPDQDPAYDPYAITFSPADPAPPAWHTISRQLRAPFDPKDVDFMPKGKANEQTGKAQVVAYCDARAVQDRLDAVVGAGNWAFDWEPVVVERGEVMVAKGTLTIHGVAKSDAGTASNFEQSLGAVSHCFKRAAVQWGIGRYLYDLAPAYVSVEKGGRIPPQVIQELRAKLPRPAGPQAPTTPAPSAAPAPSQAPVRATPVPHAPPPGPIDTTAAGRLPHLAPPKTPRERMADLGWKDDKAYLAKMHEKLGKKASYSAADMAKWIEFVAEEERQAAERAATPLAQLTGGTRPN